MRDVMPSNLVGTAYRFEGTECPNFRFENERKTLLHFGSKFLPSHKGSKPRKQF